MFWEWFRWQMNAVKFLEKDILDWNNDLMYDIYWHYRNKEK